MVRSGFALVLTALLAGCASSDSVDVDSLVDQIPSALAPTAPEIVTEVSCGDQLPIGEGLTATCRAELAGTPIEIEVTQIDENASVALRVDRQLVDVDELADEVANRFTEDLELATTVACAGAPLLVSSAGTEIVCTATDPQGIERALLVRLVDDDGTYTVELR